MTEAQEIIRNRLLGLADADYAEFQRKLMPTVAPESVIGVRTPALRKLAAVLSGTEQAAEFIGILPHKYYEENNLHAFLIERIKDYSACIKALDDFLPFVDNWATCDMMRPKVFNKHLNELPPQINIWISSGETYKIRFGIEMLMTFYLDESFSPEYPETVASVSSDEYYVIMMKAWYFATALAKQYNAVIPYIEQNRLDKETHNKTIRKAVESYRITDEQKAYLRSLKR